MFGKRHLRNKEKSNIHPWGLIVLLLSNATGYAANIPDLDHDKGTGILHSQKTLVEVMEMIRISHLLHQTVQSFSQDSDLAIQRDLIFGNKIALLSGDYLLSNAFAELSALRNQEVNELMASTVRDLNESEFIGDRDEQNNPLPSKPNGRPTEKIIHSVNDLILDDVLKPMEREDCLGIPENEWTLRHILGGGSLFAKCCQGALKLAGQPDNIQKNGFLFGINLALAWQASKDLEPFRPNTSLTPGSQFNLISAPVLFHLEHDLKSYVEIERGTVSIENIDYLKLYREIGRGPGVEMTKQLQRKYSNAAMIVLNEFPASDARKALQDIISAMDLSSNF